MNNPFNPLKVGFGPTPQIYLRAGFWANEIYRTHIVLVNLCMTKNKIPDLSTEVRDLCIWWRLCDRFFVEVSVISSDKPLRV